MSSHPEQLRKEFRKEILQSQISSLPVVRTYYWTKKNKICSQTYLIFIDHIWFMREFEIALKSNMQARCHIVKVLVEHGVIKYKAAQSSYWGGEPESGYEPGPQYDEFYAALSESFEYDKGLGIS